MIHPDLERAWSSIAEAKKIVSISCYCYFNAAAVLNIFIVIYFCCSCSLKGWNVPDLLARKLENHPRERRD